MKKSKLFRTLTLAVAAALCMATTTVTAYAGGADPDPVPLPETTEAPAEVPGGNRRTHHRRHGAGGRTCHPAGQRYAGG